MTDAKRRSLLGMLKLFDVAVVVLSSGLAATLVVYSEHTFRLRSSFRSESSCRIVRFSR